MKERATEARRQDAAAATPLVSVIIPCYNYAQFLGEAIESVLAQTYGEVEVIVVDDGSTDNTREIAGRYETVKYIYQENAGRSTARNTGVQHSRGEFVLFLDADDRLLPGALRTNLDLFQQQPECAFVSGHCRVIDARGQELAAPRQRVVQRDHYVELLGGGTYIWCPATVLYRRRLFDFVHGFDPALVPVEDYDLYLRVTRDFAVYGHGEVIAEYRQHSSNTSRDLAAMQKAALAAHQAQWDTAKGTKSWRAAYRRGRRFWQEEYPLQHMVRRIREMVRERLAPDAVIAVATGGRAELLRLNGRQAWHFPATKSAAELVAEGPRGSVTTDPWIEADKSYEFTLCQGADDRKPIARVLVHGVAHRAFLPSDEPVADAAASASGAWLRARANPVPAGDKPGTATIDWDTADDSVGTIYVSRVGEYAGRDPRDAEEARALLEAARVEGAQYFVVPARSFYWLESYRRFREEMERRYPILIREEGTCVVFDLRGVVQDERSFGHAAGETAGAAR